MPYLANRRPSGSPPQPASSHRGTIMTIMALAIFVAVVAFCFLWIAGPPA